ncbi:hypothetical protein V8D89_005784 [Ganoderma adspersum]
MSDNSTTVASTVVNATLTALSSISSSLNPTEASATAPPGSNRFSVPAEDKIIPHALIVIAVLAALFGVLLLLFSYSSAGAAAVRAQRQSRRPFERPFERVRRRKSYLFLISATHPLLCASEIEPPSFALPQFTTVVHTNLFWTRLPSSPRPPGL